MNPWGVPFAFFGVVTMVTQRVTDESGNAVIEGPPAVLIGAFLTGVGLVMTFLV